MATKEPAVGFMQHAYLDRFGAMSLPKRPCVFQTGSPGLYSVVGLVTVLGGLGLWCPFEMSFPCYAPRPRGNSGGWVKTSALTRAPFGGLKLRGFWLAGYSSMRDIFWKRGMMHPALAKRSNETGRVVDSTRTHRVRSAGASGREFRRGGIRRAI